MMSKFTKYLLVYREKTDMPWSPIMYLCDDIEEAQKKLFNYSHGSPYDWNIFKCESVLLSAHGEEETHSPKIVKESTRR